MESGKRSSGNMVIVGGVFDSVGNIYRQHPYRNNHRPNSNGDADIDTNSMDWWIVIIISNQYIFMISLRQRIRKTGINCLPWKIWKGEIDYLPVSAKTLFKRNGIGIDVWEINLKSEGWLFKDEILLEVLKVESNLTRRHLSQIMNDDSNFGLIPDDWTEEEYEGYFENKM